MQVNFTISDELAAKAEAIARQRGVTLGELIRELLRGLIAADERARSAGELLRLMREYPGHLPENSLQLRALAHEDETE